jgi:uracil-DNA glycosylase family 4
VTPLQMHVAKWSDCTACELHDQRRTVVTYRGTVPCDVLLIGEAPGESEDANGYPFVGPAGNLLDRIVRESLGAAGRIDAIDGRSDLALAFTNLVCCFPKEAKREGINEPPDAAIKACVPRLKEFIELCRPKLLVLVGQLASNWIDKVLPHREVKSCRITHPAAMLRAPAVQRGLMVQKAVVVLSQAMEELCL